MGGYGTVELARGERVLPGLWRLRLSLPMVGVPHVNAWAISAGDGLVLVDCGMNEPPSASRPGSMIQLELALAQVGLQLEQIRDLVITHAHHDHFGQAATVVERTGAQLWMHPNHQHAIEMLEPAKRAERLARVGREAGLPEATVAAALEALDEHLDDVAGWVEPDRELVPGAQLETDLGTWQVYETPGHAPSHVCLHQPERRLLISGDHLLGHIAPYFDYGFTPDPIGEFMTALDRIAHLDSRLALTGHGRPVTDVQGHIVATRDVVEGRIALARDLAARAPIDALDVALAIYGGSFRPEIAFRLNETLAILHHLGRRGELYAADDGIHWHQP